MDAQMAVAGITMAVDMRETKGFRSVEFIINNNGEELAFVAVSQVSDIDNPDIWGKASMFTYNRRVSGSEHASVMCRCLGSAAWLLEEYKSQTGMSIETKVLLSGLKNDTD